MLRKCAWRVKVYNPIPSRLGLGELKWAYLPCSISVNFLLHEKSGRVLFRTLQMEKGDGAAQPFHEQ